jgi:hypothetical protein
MNLRAGIRDQMQELWQLNAIQSHVGMDLQAASGDNSLRREVAVITQFGL